MKLNDLETEFNFQFPPLYHILGADGMLNVGEYIQIGTQLYFLS